MFGKVGLKNTFLFREPECDPVPELMISRQKIGLLVIVSRYWKYVDRISRFAIQLGCWYSAFYWRGTSVNKIAWHMFAANMLKISV